MKRMIGTIVVLVVAVTGVLLAGCATSEKIAESLAGKNVAGSGFIAVQNLGIDPETKIPSMKSTVISGDFQTIKAGSSYLNYRNEKSAAWYNAQNITTRQSLTITTENKGSMAEVLRYALGIIDKLPEPEAPGGTGKAGIPHDQAEVNMPAPQDTGAK